jgi:hypothetical protein
MLVPISSLNNDLHVVVAAGYPDGTFWASIEDSQPHRTQVCIDGRADSPTRYRMFEMARHPSESTARLVPLGSEEEDLIVGLLSRWNDASETLKQGSREEWIADCRNLLLKLRLCDPCDEPGAVDQLNV